MRAILLLLASLVFLVTIFMCGVFFTAYVIAEPEPHKFAHIDTPDLWTPKPIRVETVEQSYERLPAVTKAASVPASDLPGSGKAEAQQASSQPADLDNTVTGSVADQAPAQEDALAPEGSASTAAIDTAQAEWCYARYRSYRVEDNSYQPFSGGPRRQCEAPGAKAHGAASAASRIVVEDTPSTARADMDNAVEGQLVADRGLSDSNSEMRGGSHESWCFARYRSYRAEDNSYQPFDGGPRRACQSPFG